MTSPLSASKKRKVGVAIALAAIVVAVGLLNNAPKRQPAAPAAPATAPADANVPRSKEQGMAALIALPELKAWSAQIERASGGKARGALIEYDTTPRVVNGKSYWQFSFVENTADAAHRWDSFLVAAQGDEILVEDLPTDSLLTLEQWRMEKRPLERSAPLGLDD